MTVGFPMGLYSLSSVRETMCNHPRDRSQGVFPLISARFDVSHISFQLLSARHPAESALLPSPEHGYEAGTFERKGILKN